MMDNNIDCKALEAAVSTAEHFASCLHEIPESSFQETETTRHIRTFCRKCAVPLIDLGMETGAVGFLDCGKADTVALRADIDAITTEAGPRHFCGHDFHTASLLGVMQYLSERRDTLPHNVVFLFQPGEESTNGAAAMLEHGLLARLPQRPFRLFGIHNRPEVDCGKVVVHSGALMAEKSEFRLCFTGRIGHGGTPHLCIDPLVAAADLTMAVQSIVSRNVDPLDAAVCTVCSIHGGSTQNIAPESAVLTGAVRTLQHKTHIRVRERLERLAEQIALAYECGKEWVWTVHIPGVDNKAEMTDVARRAAEKAAGCENVVDAVPCLGSEDYAVFMQEIPGFFYWVGSGVPGQQNAAWHSADFRIADGYLHTAVPLLICAAMEE